MYGLVLEGGGAKGAYQIGSYLALKELGYEFEAVVGTSIGAINGAMIVQGDLDKCINLWNTMSMEEFYGEDEATKEIEQISTQNEFVLISKMKDIVDKFASFGINPKPLKELVNNYISEEKIRNSKIKYGLVAINLSDRCALEVFSDEIKEGELKNLIIGSCYLPAFKRELIGGKYYLDGGFYNNTPYNMVEKLGLKPIIIRLHPHGINNFPENAIVIEPREKLVRALEFDPKKSNELMRLGYFDTLKTINGLLGDRYYIKPFGEEVAFKILKKFYLSKIDEFKISEKFSNLINSKKIFEELIPKFAEEVGLKTDFTYETLLIKLIEKESIKKNIDYLKIYEIGDLYREIL